MLYLNISWLGPEETNESAGHFAVTFPFVSICTLQVVFVLFFIALKVMLIGDLVHEKAK